MSTRRLKKEVLALLAEPDLETILDRLRRYPAKDVVNVLFSAICHTDELVRWHGISAMGEMVARLAGQDMEEARIIMRRLLWSLNDESGGIGWGAPEAMAEIMVHHAGLAEEYVHMLISYMHEDGEEIWQDGNFLEHELLQRGLLWGIARLADRRPALLAERGVGEEILPYLGSPDPGVRGMAALAAGRLGLARARQVLQEMLADKAEVRLYEDGVLRTVTVAGLAGQALARIAP
ncbi:MAG TPA: HEAT repeat domain-containing protein [Desulfobulbus sp.]|nr:HEAT repeat domain-containing protein [Desulfobulbus sp.]